MIMEGLNRQFSVHEHQTLKDVPFVTLEHKTILSRWGIFVAKVKNTLFWSKLYIF